MINVANKIWPACPLKDKNLNKEQILQFLKIRAEYEKSAFVSEGHVETRILGPKEFARPIPAGECAISSLVCLKNGKVYGGTSGKNAHLFFYDPSPDADTVAEIGVVGQNVKVSSLVADARGMVYGATDSPDKNNFLFRYKSCEILADEVEVEGKTVREIFDVGVEDQIFHSIVDPCHSAGKIEKLTALFEGEGIATMVMDEGRNVIYGLTSRTGVFFVLDPDKMKITFQQTVDSIGKFSKALAIDKSGAVYGAGGKGGIFRYLPDQGRLEKLNIYAPCLRGREMYNEVQCWAYDGGANLLYGGTVDGVLFAFDPDLRKMVALGKPLDQSNIRTLAPATDGRIYGVGGERGGCCHMFVFDRHSRELKDLGVLLARVECPWYGYEIECSVTGHDGRIYFGESDRISNLFMYFPAPRGNFRWSEIENKNQDVK